MKNVRLVTDNYLNYIFEENIRNAPGICWMTIMLIEHMKSFITTFEHLYNEARPVKKNFIIIDTNHG